MSQIRVSPRRYLWPRRMHQVQRALSLADPQKKRNHEPWHLAVLGSYAWVNLELVSGVVCTASSRVVMGSD